MGLWVLAAFDKRTDELRHEFELPELTAAEVRELVGADRDNPMIGVHDVPVDAAATLIDGVDVDPAEFDWQIAEYATKPREWRDGGYLPPRFLPAFLDARPVKAKTPLDDR